MNLIASTAQFGAIPTACGLILALASSPSLSQDIPASGRMTSASTEMLLFDEPLVVTASRQAQCISDSPAAVTVISEEDIRSSGATTLIDLLRSAPGVDVMESNKSTANASIRGFN